MVGLLTFLAVALAIYWYRRVLNLRSEEARQLEITGQIGRFLGVSVAVTAMAMISWIYVARHS